MFGRLYHFGVDVLECLASLRETGQSSGALISRVHGESEQVKPDSQNAYAASARDILVYEELLRECSRQAQQILLEQEKLRAESERAEYWKREYELSVHDAKMKLLLISARNDALTKELSLLRCNESHSASRTRRDAELDCAHTC